MLDKLVEDWHNSISYALRKEKCQHLISSGINQTQRSKPPTKKNRKARSKLIQNLPYLFFFFSKMEVTYRKLKLEVKVLCWEAEVLENMKADSRVEGGKRLNRRYCFRYFPPLWNPKYDWAICVKRSISSSDKGLIARSSTGKCHVKINQSQSIRTEKHPYIRRSVAISPRLHQPFPVLFVPFCNRVTGYHIIPITK